MAAERFGPCERRIDFLDGAAASLDPDQKVGNDREHIPICEIVETRDNAGERRLGLT
jgi:hypothetical protein